MNKENQENKMEGKVEAKQVEKKVDEVKDKKVEEKKKDKKFSSEKLSDLKIELLRQVQKRKGIKKEIARLLTLKNKLDSENRIKEKK